MSDGDYLDFELRIETLGTDRLRVQVVTSPVGSVSVEVPNTLTAEETARILGILDGSAHVSRGEGARIARAFGEKLFALIFSGQVYAAYLASQSRAGETGLRIKLGLDDAKTLEELPWELLRDPNGDFLVLSRTTPVIRYPRLLTVRPLLDVSLPLRVLVMISSPNDLPQLDVEAEWRALQDSTADLRARGLLELHRIDDAHLNVLQRKLREGTAFQVFHFIGHAGYDDKQQVGMLAFEDPRTGGSLLVSGEALARELSEENAIRLVVLNACQGARGSEHDRYAGIASSIVARGVPSVVAMQFEISDSASREFSAEFYKALSEGYPIEGSMAEARRAISTSLNNLEWVTPVLYLRAPTGVLFPKRASVSHVNVGGGLRDALMRAPLLALLGVLGVVAVAVFVISALSSTGGNVSLTPSAQIATFTPTEPAKPKDIDLLVSSLRFLPPKPIPGQLTTIAIRIENQGQSESGAFEWSWFASTTGGNTEPTLSGEVRNLGSGKSITVTTSFRFPWWGKFNTAAWVNFRNTVPETNIFNNFQQRLAELEELPFEINFANLPDGELLESAPLSEDAFEVWGIGIKAQGGADCADAVVRSALSLDGVPELVTGRPDGAPGCESTPVEFLLNAVEDDPQVVSVSLGYIPSVVGTYTLEMLGGDGAVKDKISFQIGSGSLNKVSLLTLTGRAGEFDLARLVFRPPAGAPTVIRSLARALE